MNWFDKMRSHLPEKHVMPNGGDRFAIHCLDERNPDPDTPAVDPVADVRELFEIEGEYGDCIVRYRGAERLCTHEWHLGWREIKPPLLMAERRSHATVAIVEPPTPSLELAVSVPQTVVIVSGELIAQIGSFEQEMGALPEIVDQTTLSAAEDLIKRATKLSTLIEKSRQACKAPYLDVGRKIDEAARTVMARIQAVIAEAKQQLASFLNAVEQERQRILAEEARRAQLAAQQAVAEQRLTPALSTTPLPERVEASTAVVKEVVITDPAQIPREYLVPDMAKIRAAALAGTVIPGVTVRDVQQIRSRR